MLREDAGDHDILPIAIVEGDGQGSPRQRFALVDDAKYFRKRHDSKVPLQMTAHVRKNGMLTVSPSGPIHR